MKKYVLKMIVGPVVAMLKQGVSHEKLALSIALGIMIGIFPVLGITTFLCAAAAVILRLNLPVIQLANWIICPVQVILLVPFFVAGSTLFGNEPFLQDVSDMVVLFRSDWISALLLLKDVTIQAVLVWFMLAPVLIMVMYAVLRYLLKMLHANGFTMESRK